METIEVTATRVPEPVSQVPADISVVGGDELRARGATDLRSALALVSGTEAPSGGDTGPAGAVPSLWGLHEFDAFLLVVDGVPWGGAFNPAIPTLNLTDVERIEILKGSAPVMYGATSFVGVIHVIHYPAGRAANQAEIAYGSYNSVHGAASIALPMVGEFKQSLAIDGQRQGFADSREEVKGGHGLYRLSGPLGGGTLRFDAEVTIQRQVPPSPVVRDGAALTTATPRDANFNPADARVDENKYHATLGYALQTPLGLWDTTLSLAHSDITDIRGFVRSDLTDDGSENADSQHQRRTILDTYADTHFSTEIMKDFDLVYGADALYGLGRQSSVNGAYYIPLSGRVIAPSTATLHIDEDNTIADKRSFFGQYAQVDWKFADGWDFIGGLRLNETRERRASAHHDGFDPTADEAATEIRSTTKLSGTAGVSYRAWHDGNDKAVIYADYRNSFKPAAIDFGPDYTPDVLKPETAESYEAGLKGTLLARGLEYEINFFLMNFTNLVLQTTDAAGDPVLQNAGGERLKGVEGKLTLNLGDDVVLMSTASYHRARFTAGVATEGGDNVNLVGKELTLSPHFLASVGAMYTPPQGFRASAIVNYIGRRYLDLANEAPTKGYATLDGSIGWRFGRYTLSVDATNLTDQRPPVTQSEFGDMSYYLLPARMVFGRISAVF